MRVSPGGAYPDERSAGARAITPRAASRSGGGDVEAKLGTDLETLETRDWIESLEEVLHRTGPERVRRLLQDLQIQAQRRGVELPVTSQTPYVNSIPVDLQPPYPGDRTIERRLKSLVRWNAMAMVVRANRVEDGIGGHISTFASAATLYEVGFNHFFRGRDAPGGGDHVYIQGHASPGIYARAFLEGRLSEQQLVNFRRELAKGGGLSSYPHPWLMPEFWEYPTVSMGLGPLMAIYQARFLRYLEDRGLKPRSDSRVWAFLGDGETDEPEALGAITLASRERLDNLIFVVNCNLQRLDGPVRGNGKIIQELEAIFRGSGWNVLKVLWGGDWDPLFERDRDGRLARRLGEGLDGEAQKAAVEGGAYMRKQIFGSDPALLELVRHLSDDQLWKLRLGGHDPEKVYAAYKVAVEHRGSPTVILARTIKGYGLGEAGEGRNVTHQQKKLHDEELEQFRTRFEIPIRHEEVAHAPFYRPPEDSPEIVYLRDRRRALGGVLPRRVPSKATLVGPGDELYREFHEGTGGRPASTTMAFVKLLTKLLRDKEIGRHVVPIVPDEARTFGMDALFRQVGIYSHVGQLYEPVDAASVLYYKEARDGQILEEGITEAGSMSSFLAAGTSYAHSGVATLPFFIYYSMFGFQRIGDLIWAAGDMRTRGFLVGATAGRTTLAGEGLQHQDGHSHVLALPVPNLLAYDPAYAYEIAVIVQEGIRRMYERREDVFYYLTVGNENYPQPAMPDGAREGILKGLYKLRAAPVSTPLQVQLVGSGSILNEVLKAQGILAERYGVAAEVWSATSYKELRREALECERQNLLHPEGRRHEPYVAQTLGQAPGPVIAASDYLKVMPDSIARWLPRSMFTLGTDGFGRSDSRAALRDFFEVDARYVAVAALHALAREGKLEAARVRQAIRDQEIDPEKLNPMTS
ncbi:MAG: pyruvate dehydrogenase (acetyl-transferring), homodimeric type [Deltaproteobacteria bacterium]|nr:pyruvate dehydrogenase (acetyl-transferring), homodimeric type [Deltaproteobacteria bacterium]